MKKRIFTVAAIAGCLAILASGTLAYFTAEETAHNVITSGAIDIELVEKMIDEKGNEIDFPENGISGVMPGDTISKIVSVKNTEEKDAWIRIWVNTAISEPGDPITNPTIKNLPLIINVDGKEIELVSFTADAENWIYQDGYYYYKNPVPAGESTAPLFKEVEIAPEMGNAYQNCKVMIDVKAEAVQYANNGSTVLEALGWPE